MRSLFRFMQEVYSNPYIQTMHLNSGLNGMALTNPNASAQNSSQNNANRKAKSKAKSNTNSKANSEANSKAKPEQQSLHGVSL
ncbi:MAG: hypothetical protein HC771_07200 [Synechococcales cyanobacterium CRU_2_2]|nr:hypothetical protein [Synechococcales cyanobacterium CRU_2_2]